MSMQNYRTKSLIFIKLRSLIARLLKTNKSNSFPWNEPQQLIQLLIAKCDAETDILHDDQKKTTTKERLTTFMNS